MIEFHLDSRSGVSPYMQIGQQVRHALRLGLLREGDQLPTVKMVVARLAINPNTVLKAYRELEHAGLVAARPGSASTSSRPRKSWFPNFPDPTSSGELTHEMVANAGINLHQPAVLPAGDACTSITHGVITDAIVARFVAGQ